MFTHDDVDAGRRPASSLKSDVVESPSARLTLMRVICLLLVIATGLSSVLASEVPSAYAVSSAGQANNGSVTDTQNLLGSQSAKISDEITSTYQQTGVHVRLLFLANFEGSKNPDQWVANVLESTKPDPNTVMLAVASNDGRLVVAVSKNSESWLKKQENVNQMSQAALNYLQDGKTPDWPGCAIGFMKEINDIHHQRQVTRRVIIIVCCVVVLIGICVVAWFVFVHRQRKHGHARHRLNKRSR
jgi:hypothetical protein